MEAVERRPAKNCGRFADGSNWTAPESSERFCVAQWQRRASPGRRRENVFGHREGFGMAESDYFFGFGGKDDRHGKIRSEDDRAVRICAASLLAGGHESGRGLWLQHGDEAWAGDSAARTAGAVH